MKLIVFIITGLFAVTKKWNKWSWLTRAGSRSTFEEQPASNLAFWISIFMEAVGLKNTGFFLKTVWLNGWVFVYKFSGCGFESRCCHLNFRYHACFEQGVQSTKECRFALKPVHDIIITFSYILVCWKNIFRLLAKHVKSICNHKW